MLHACLQWGGEGRVSWTLSISMSGPSHSVELQREVLLRLAPQRQQGRGEAASAGVAPQQQHGARGGGGGPGGVVGAGAGQRVAGVPGGLGEGGAGEERALAAARDQPGLGVAVPGRAEGWEAAPGRAVTSQNLTRQVGLARQPAGHQDGWGVHLFYFF